MTSGRYYFFLPEQRWICNGNTLLLQWQYSSHDIWLFIKYSLIKVVDWSLAGDFMDIYVLLLITLYKWHLCCNRGGPHRKSTGYVLLPNSILSGSIPNRFFVRASALSSMCATIFLTAAIAWRTCGELSSGLAADGAINLFTSCCWASSRGVRNSVCRDVVAGFLAAFPFTSLSPLLHRRARARGSVRYVCSSVSECKLFSLAYFMMSLYLILTVKMLLFTTVLS